MTIKDTNQRYWQAVMLEIGSFYQNINGKPKAIKPFNFHFKQIIDLFDVCFVEFSEKFKENRDDTYLNV